MGNTATIPRLLPRLDVVQYAEGMAAYMRGEHYVEGICALDSEPGAATQDQTDSWYVGWCDAQNRREDMYHACVKRLGRA